jgi:effector-binding domain-containing protein
MEYKCEVVDYPARIVMSVRAKSSIQELSQVIYTKYAQIAGYLAGLGESPSDSAFVAYYNMDMNDLDIEIGFPISKKLAGKDDMSSGEIPAGKYATCLHIGPYNQLEQAYQALKDWISANGYHPTGVAYEFYLNDPAVTPPDELKTLIGFPLR